MITKQRTDKKVEDGNFIMKNTKCPICGSTEKEWEKVMKEYICKDCLFVLPI